MGQQFNFDDFDPLNILNDHSSQLTDKHLMTHSEVSHEHFLEDLLNQHRHEEDKGYQLPRQASTARERHKQNSKRYRDRRRQQQGDLERQLRQLQQENQMLKEQKYCKWCRKPYGGWLKMEKRVQVVQEMQYGLKDKSMEIEVDDRESGELRFDRPELEQKQAKSGRIWIALGVLMLVLGIAIHGLSGAKGVIHQIQLDSGQKERWVEQFQQRSKDDYFRVKMRTKSQPRPLLSQQSQLRIFYGGGSQMQSQRRGEEQVSINKELLYGIHAEIEDIGLYI